MITIKHIPISKILEDKALHVKFCELLNEQWKEVDHRRKHTELDINFDTYLAIESAGAHIMLMAFDGDQLIGYMSAMCNESPHNSKLTTVTDTVFILPQYRSKGIGTMLIKELERQSRDRKASYIMVTFKNSQKHDNIINDLGFFSYETIYSKYIGGEE